jgi:hypothetical protein
MSEPEILPPRHSSVTKTRADEARMRARSQPNVFFASTDLIGLMTECVKLGHLLATEKNDIEAIKLEHALRAKEAEQEHQQIMLMIQNEYASREKMIAYVNEQIKMFAEMGKLEIAEALSMKVLEISSKSILSEAIEMKKAR